MNVPVSPSDLIYAAKEEGLGWEMLQVLEGYEEPDWDYPEILTEKGEKIRQGQRLTGLAFRQLKGDYRRCYLGHTKKVQPSGRYWCPECTRLKGRERMSGLSVGDVKISSGDHAIMPGLQDELERLVPQLQPELDRVSCVRIRGNGNMRKRHSSKPVRWKFMNPTITGFRMQAIGEYARQDVHFITNDKPALEKKMSSVMEIVNIEEEETQEVEVKEETKNAKMAVVDEMEDFMFQNLRGDRTKMAAELGCTPGALGHWLTGRYTPRQRYIDRFRDMQDTKAKDAAVRNPAPLPLDEPELEEHYAQKFDESPVLVTPDRRKRTIGHRVDAIMEALEGLEKEEAEKLWSAVISLI